LSDDDDILSDDDDILAEDDTELLDDDLQDSPLAATPLEVEEANNEAWALSGGWYRDGSSIRYRPSDHADQFLKAWLDISSKGESTIDSNIFRSLSDEESVGSCMKCHSIVSETSDKQISNKVHWSSFKPKDIKADFSRFSHVSHFSLMNDDGCSSCHLLNISETEKTSVLGSAYSSSFLDMDKQTCTQCHQKGRAPDNCLTCHNYHVEPLMQSKHNISDTLRGDDGE